MMGNAPSMFRVSARGERPDSPASYCGAMGRPSVLCVTRAGDIGMLRIVGIARTAGGPPCRRIAFLYFRSASYRIRAHIAHILRIAQLRAR